MTLLISSITPAIIFMFVIYQRDIIREPFIMLLKAFSGGVLSVILTLLVGIFLFNPIGENLKQYAVLGSFYDAYLSAGLVEECCKFLFLYWFIWKSKHFDQNYDGIVYAVFVSLGFALIENILYVFQGGMTVAIARAFTAVPAHGFFAVIMGYYFSLSKFHADDDQRKGFLIKALLFPILVHGTYNFCLMYVSHENANPLLSLLLMLLFTIVVIGFWIVGIRKIKKHIQKDKDLGLIG